MIIDDKSKDLVVIKSRQLGLSEMGVGKLIHFVDTHSYDHANALYTFPTVAQMRDFVKGRINPLTSSGYYGSIFDEEADSIEVKRIRDSFLYFRTSSKPGAVEGIDVDYVALDEYDRVPNASEESARASMDSSKYKIMNRWSTPSTPNMGIHGLFNQSDQNVYMHKCGRCNFWNELSYKEYDGSSKYAGGNILTVNPDGVDVLAKTVVDGSFQFVCKACGKPLDRWYNGSWTSRISSRNKDNTGTRGYFISQMNAVWVR